MPDHQDMRWNYAKNCTKIKIRAESGQTDLTVVRLRPGIEKIKPSQASLHITRPLPAITTIASTARQRQFQRDLRRRVGTAGQHRATRRDRLQHQSAIHRVTHAHRFGCLAVYRNQGCAPAINCNDAKQGIAADGGGRSCTSCPRFGGPCTPQRARDGLRTHRWRCRQRHCRGGGNCRAPTFHAPIAHTGSSQRGHGECHNPGGP
jgi:hypothetical protein